MPKSSIPNYIFENYSLLNCGLCQTGFSKNRFFGGLTKKKSIWWCIWEYFLLLTGTCVKFLLQNLLLNAFHSQTVIFNFSQTGISENGRIQVFWGLKMEKTLLVQLKIFFMSVICILKTFNAITNFGNALFSNCDPWEDLSISRPKGKKSHWCSWRYVFYVFT